ncbi:MAG: hypothetical protein WB762_07855 [Candidatus Sulfotelmatobacter sp.]
MTERDMTPAIGPLIRRWAAPVIAAWLLHLGAWSIIGRVAEPSVMSVLTNTLNWLIQHFTAKGWPIEEVSWPSRFIAYQMSESLIPILVGLLIGWGLLRRKRRISRQSP